MLRQLVCSGCERTPVEQLRSNSAEERASEKAKLKLLAGFERECYEMDMRRLKGLVEPTKMKGLKTFCNAVDLIGQIYAVDDISPEIEKS